MKTLLSQNKKKVKVVEKPKKGVKCPDCKKVGGLTAVCVMVVRAPFAKGGGMKLAGVSITHKTAKEAWEKRPKKIVCTNCGVKFTYEDGKGLVKLDKE